MPEHTLAARECWCTPRLEQPCPIGGGRHDDVVCQWCAGSGWTVAYDASAPALIIHQDVTYA